MIEIICQDIIITYKNKICLMQKFANYQNLQKQQILIKTKNYLLPLNL